MRYVEYVTAFLGVLTISIAGFRGRRSTQPPVEVFPDMNRQAKYKPQAESKFFADGRADRPLPAGVVPRGRTVAPDPAFLRADDFLYRGKTPAGEFARGFPPPLAIDQRFMERGRERYTIYCAPCHGALGDGQGITKAHLRRFTEHLLVTLETLALSRQDVQSIYDRIALEADEIAEDADGYGGGCEAG